MARVADEIRTWDRDCRHRGVRFEIPADGTGASDPTRGRFFLDRAPPPHHRRLAVGQNTWRRSTTRDDYRTHERPGGAFLIAAPAASPYPVRPMPDSAWVSKPSSGIEASDLTDRPFVSALWLATVVDVTETEAGARHKPSALELIAECVARMRMTDPTDTRASLLAAWHGFGTAEAAGRMLRDDNDEDAVLARNATAVFEAVAVLMRRAPSMPYTNFVVENVSGLIPEDHRPTDDSDQFDDPDLVVGVSAAGQVRRGILALALELNTLLPEAAENAAAPDDRIACEHGTRLAYELSNCWEGKPSSYLNGGRDLIGDRKTPPAGGKPKQGKNKRKPKRT